MHNYSLDALLFPTDFFKYLQEHLLRISASTSHIDNKLWPNDMQILNQRMAYISIENMPYSYLTDHYLMQICMVKTGWKCFIMTAINRFEFNDEMLFALDPLAIKKPNETITHVQIDLLNFLIRLFMER